MLQQGFSYEDLSLLLTGGDQILTDKKKHFLLDENIFPSKTRQSELTFVRVKTQSRDSPTGNFKFAGRDSKFSFVKKVT